MMTPLAPRQNVYYWKCDRAAAFHGTAQGAARVRPELADSVRAVVRRHFGVEPTDIRLGTGQGNHLTFTADVAGRRYFIRVEDGPEQDDYLAVESCVMDKVRALGVPTPVIFAADASRRDVSFAWQIMELIDAPDLNRHFKAHTLKTEEIASELGRLIALWQGVPVAGFGFFDSARAAAEHTLKAAHHRYADYYDTRLEAHLGYLVDHGLLRSWFADARENGRAAGRNRAASNSA
jgi:aminoglycoside phosphotransferase (APT) family kinase protein